jgi:phosphoglycolate phosphatase-like HAD superfamily hydrolase
MLSKDLQPSQESQAQNSLPKLGNPEALIEAWLELSNTRVSQNCEPEIACFTQARNFLEKLSSEYSGSQVLVYSSIPEADALNRWEVAGLGNCFMRIAGPERGDFRAYLRTALQNGYDRTPILVVGTSNTAMRAAQDVGARFYPIVPGFEDSSWEELSSDAFPAFIEGSLAFLQGSSHDFLGMLGGLSEQDA